VLLIIGAGMASSLMLAAELRQQDHRLVIAESPRGDSNPLLVGRFVALVGATSGNGSSPNAGKCAGRSRARTSFSPEPWPCRPGTLPR
jgi:hypothetical protein